MPGRVADTQHHRVLVGVAREPAVGRRPEHLDGGAAQREPLPGAHRLDGDAPRCGDPQGFVDRRRRRGRVRWNRSDEQRADVDAVEHGGKPVAVVGVGMAQHHRVQAAHPPVAQVAQRPVAVGSGVDQQPGRRQPRIAGRFHQQRVALAHVERDQGQMGHRAGAAR